jgi:pimeloyl-ACP methyl ester carboxylesterase
METELKPIEYESKDLTAAERQSISGKFVEISGGQVHYELEGPENGRKVILVPGFTAPLFVWDHTFRTLVNAGFRVLRYDLFGHGFSDRPKVKYSMDFLVDQLYKLLERLNIHDYDLSLVGFNLGGGICMTFADLYMNMVSKISLISPIGFPSDSSAYPFYLRIPLLNQLTMRFFSPQMLIEGQQTDFQHQNPNVSEYLERYKEQFMYKGIMNSLRSMLKNISFTDLEEVYARVGKKIPIQLFWGELDQNIPFDTYKQVINTVAKVEFHAITGGSHIPQYTHSEFVNPLLKTFLDK